MFKISDNFIAYDNNKQPYTFSCERHTETANLHAAVTNKGFSMKSIGNRFILNSPKFSTAVFRTSIRISFPFEINPCFRLIFGYDKETRTGKAIQFTYDTSIGKLSAVLVAVNNGIYTPISDTVDKEFILCENEFTPLTLSIHQNETECIFGETIFIFKHAASSGYFAVDRDDFIGELIFKDFEFVTEEAFSEENIINTPPLGIPLVNGGDIPYTIQYSIDKIDGEYYLTSALDGGTKSRPSAKSERIGQYVAEIDYMTSPYVGLSADEHEMIFNISDRENCFVDPNIFWDCQKIFFRDVELPIVNRFKITDLVPSNSIVLIFGYKKLRCGGYAQQSGGCEFRLSADGKPVWQGGALNGEDLYEIVSPHDKKAISLIDGSSSEYENIVEHLKKNHYFSYDEKPCFSLLFRTETNPAFLKIKAEIKNIYETETLQASDTETSCKKWFKKYNELAASATFDCLPVGVYKIIFSVFYGNSEHKKISHVFEVYNENTDLCPPIASGLPFMFTMNNEQKKLARNGFDLSNPMPSCDFGHYISCATTTPVEAEKQEMWKNLKIFGRKWFAWLAIRTCDDYLSPEHNVTIKNADYLFHSGINTDCDPLGPYSLYPNRVDHFMPYFYNYPGVKKLINSFFEEHPEYLAKISYRPESNESVTNEIFDEFVNVCGNELIEYINKANCEYVTKHNRELEKINPKVKRSVYGPFPPYYTPVLTYHSLKYFGFPENEALSNEYYSGFAIFEDYPFSCSYQTHRGAFSAMTLLTKFPKLTLHPELYTGSRGGCIDGAVKYAHAPMGDYECPPYQNSTLAFEYVFNTAYKTKDKFGYWNTYGFHRGLDTCDYINEFVHNWHYVYEHKPLRPLRSAAYIIDFEGDKDIYRPECGFYNRSESGLAFLHECARESGVPCGFGVNPDALSSLSEKDCDLLVVPSLAHADKTYVSEIRRLYNAGVSLIALSDISGLEDIFGVEKAPVTETIRSVEYKGKKELVYNTENSFTYKPTTANVQMTANDTLPVIISTDRTALINTAVFSLGCAVKSKTTGSNGAFIVGKLIKQALKDIFTNMSAPLAFGKNVGITLFEDEHKNTMLLAINYTPFDNCTHDITEAVVEININDVTEVSSDVSTKTACLNNAIKELRFDIQPHGFAFIKLK